MSFLVERFEFEVEEKIMKVVFFDLDDILFWDEKSVRIIFVEICL